MYYRYYGKALKQESLNVFLDEILKDLRLNTSEKIGFHDFYRYRIAYIIEEKENLIFLFITSLTDKIDNIRKQLIKCKNEFLNLFEDILQDAYNKDTFEVFDPTIDSIHRNLHPKISLVGFSGVGKTTITQLIKAAEIPMQHIPTITGDIAIIKIGKLQFHLWDFAGQDQYRYLWNSFIKGSDAVLIITDSTLQNVEKSKFFLELIKEEAPHARSAAIGNKQDLQKAMNPLQIEKIIGIKSFAMVAKDPKNRNKMIQIIADVLEMSPDVSPLLKPLLERDRLIEKAIMTVKEGKFQKASSLFDKIIDLSIEVGDYSLGKEFYNKSIKIKDLLNKIENAESTIPTLTQQEEVIKNQSSHLRESLIQNTINTLNALKELKSSRSEEFSSELTPSERISNFQIKKSSIRSARTIKENDNEENLKEIPIIQKNLGLKLNPEDFLEKISTESKETTIKENEKESIIENNSIETLDPKESLIKLKLKKGKLSKMSIDLEMQELTGEITTLQLKIRKREIEELINKIDKQIEELENKSGD